MKAPAKASNTTIWTKKVRTIAGQSMPRFCWLWLSGDCTGVSHQRIHARLIGRPRNCAVNCFTCQEKVMRRPDRANCLDRADAERMGLRLTNKCRGDAA